MVPRNLEWIYARWQQAGADLAVAEHAGQVSAVGGRTALLASLRALTRLTEEDPLALAVLSDAPGWRDEVFNRFLLRELCERVEAGQQIAPEPLGEWRPLGLPAPEHLRVLARRCLLPFSRASGARAVLLFAAFTGNETAIDPTAEDEVELLARALVFWGAPEMLASMLTGLLGAIALQSADDLLRLLARAALIRERARADVDVFRRTFVTLLQASVTEKLGFLVTLAARHARVCAALGHVDAPDWGGWYRQAFALLASYPAERWRHLREAWVADLLRGWVDGRFGQRLVAELYREWCDARTARAGSLVALTGGLGQLVKDAPSPLLAAFAPLVEGAVASAKSARDKAEVALGAERMGVSVPASLKGRILASLTAELLARTAPLDAAADAGRLAECTQGHEGRAGAVHQMAMNLGGEASAEKCELLWEILLSPPARRAGLAARLMRTIHLARLSDAPQPWVSCATALLAALWGP